MGQQWPAKTLSWSKTKCLKWLSENQIKNDEGYQYIVDTIFKLIQSFQSSSQERGSWKNNQLRGNNKVCYIVRVGGGGDKSTIFIAEIYNINNIQFFLKQILMCTFPGALYVSFQLWDLSVSIYARAWWLGVYVQPSNHCTNYTNTMGIIRNTAVCSYDYNEETR